MIERPVYLKQLEKWRDKRIIKVISGIRRAGKSTLLQLFAQRLLNDDVLPQQIIEINLEDLGNESLREYHALYRFIEGHILPGKMNYIFIDEIQNCPSFEKAVDSLLLKPNIDLYLTGSNAYFLSSELATLLAGRYIEIRLYPLSFAEFFRARRGPQDTVAADHAFADYLRYGSFPYVANLIGDEDAVHTYLEGIYNTILIKDVAQRERIRDITLLENIIQTLASNLGSPISAKRIADTLTSSGRKVSHLTIDRYLHALTDAFIFYHVPRYDIKRRQYLKNLGKYYIADTGLRRLLIAEKEPGLGHQLENIVYLELIRRYSRVNIGKLDSTEVDFVASDGDALAYYQVSASVLNERTRTRELAPLKRLADNYPKILLTLDTIGRDTNDGGIIQRNLLDWLLKGED